MKTKINSKKSNYSLELLSFLAVVGLLFYAYYSDADAKSKNIKIINSNYSKIEDDGKIEKLPNQESIDYYAANSLYSRTEVVNISKFKEHNKIEELYSLDMDLNSCAEYRFLNNSWYIYSNSKDKCSKERAIEDINHIVYKANFALKNKESNKLSWNSK